MSEELSSRLKQLSPAKRALLARHLTRSQAGRLSEPDGDAAIVHDPSGRYTSFPLTDLQQAYWIGRSEAFKLGGVAAHSYIEIDTIGLDLPRLERAWRQLVDRHDMLRSIIEPDGEQRVLATVPAYELRIVDLRHENADSAASRLRALREELSHQVLQTEWPLFDIRAALLEGGKTRLFVSLDALVVDGWSLVVLFREWKAFYDDEPKLLPGLEITFRDYVLAEQRLEQTDKFRHAKEYWLQRLESLPAAPELPLRRAPEHVKSPRFYRRQRRLDARSWTAVKARASRLGLTPSVVLLTAYADVLSVWAQQPRFSINVPRFNRQPIHPQVSDIIGELASFALLEVDSRCHETFEGRARMLQERLWHDLSHAEFSGVRIMREMARRQGGAPVMPVVFTAAPEDPRRSGATLVSEARAFGEVVYAINQTPQVWLDNHVSELDGELICDWDSVDEIFPPGMPDDMLEAYMGHLDRLAQHDAAWTEARASTASNLLPDLQRATRNEVNGGCLPLPEALVQDGFAARALEHPDGVALLTPERAFTYKELDELSTRWAWHLRRLGCTPQVPVVVAMEKGWEQIVAVLAILKSGAPYLPLDVQVPADRFRHLLERAGARRVLTQSWLDTRLHWPAHIERLCVDTTLPAEMAEPIAPAQHPDGPCYILFTSGSTGSPKGVVVGHRGVVNAVVQTNRTFNVGPADRVLALTALHHDMSVYDIFGVLTAGGALVVPGREGIRDPAHWIEMMQAHSVTIWNSVPAMMGMLAAHRPVSTIGTLRTAFLGGDWIPVPLLAEIAKFAPNARVVSVGGPTETTLWNIWFPIAEVDPVWTSVPYGRPIANVKYFVMNDLLDDRPTWVPGELCCAGLGLAHGYWNDEQATREKFVIHPQTRERLYRTGDLGRYLPDGTIEFLGRTDLQVKIDGQRIEPGEIEAALLQFPSVLGAVAVAAPDSQGRRRLAAFVVQETPASDADELRRFIAEVLPPYMVPQSVTTLDQFPLTPNGKVDRASLTALAQQRITVSQDLPPSSPLSGLASQVSGLVKQVLQLEELAPDVSLLSYGANSIDMIRIGNRLDQAFGFRPRIDELFRLQTIDRLTNYYAERLRSSSVADEGTDAPLAGENSPPSLTGELKSLLSDYRLLLDPAEREAFKKSAPGLRRGDEARAWVALPLAGNDEQLITRYRSRRSQRTFSLRPVPFDQFGGFLAGLREVIVDGAPKRLHGSPGGLYPVQAYFHIKPGRVSGVAAGTYYYHPVEHRLVTLTPNVDLERDIHIPFINTPTFDQAAFSIFLIAQLAAIAPSYGEYSVHFATIETGLITQLLELTAPDYGLGICQIGSLQFDRIRHLFALESTHLLLHSMLGGLTPVETGADRAEGVTASKDPVAQALDRLRELTDEEVRLMLEANRRVKKVEDA